MKLSQILKIGLVSCLFLFLFYTFFYKPPKVINVVDISDNTDFKNISSTFLDATSEFDEYLFYKSVKGENKLNFPEKTVSAAVIPHHTLPGYMISGLFFKLEEQKPLTIILIGPNHRDAGDAKILTSNTSWKTPFTNVGVETSITERLIKKDFVEVSDDFIEKEHSISSIIPYISFYLPNTKVVPLVLSSKLNKEDISELTNLLLNYVDENTILIAAVDFSHYLTAFEAEEKDKYTLQLLKEKNVNKILELNNDYTDSSLSLALIVSIADQENYKMEVIENTNSGFLLNDYNTPTTSYFTLHYYND